MQLFKLTQKIFSESILKDVAKNFVDYHKLVVLRVIRNSHTDIKVPDFSHYRRKSVKSSNSLTSDSEGTRKAFSGSITVIATVMGVYGLKSEIQREILYMAASADVIALAKIEIKLSEIPEGKNATFKWRGKPLFVRHRSPEQIQGSREVPWASLRDPAKDEDRCTNQDFLIVIGVCTHLGCVPIPDAGDFGPGGYYCPCHGAHFDAAGRTRKGPAPINLVIPDHRYVGDDTLVVG